MEIPKLQYNEDLYNYIGSIRDHQKSYMLCDLEVLGKGAAGITYSAYVKPQSRFSDAVVLKEQKRTRFCINEQEALKYLREKMLEGAIPGYYIFMYGYFNDGGKKYIILEKADVSLDDYMIAFNLTSKTLLQIFWHIANAVDHLEKLKFNHGDLWSENVMLVWAPGQHHLPDEDRDFTIKLIDYDSAFGGSPSINNPSFGGAEKFRTRFILGYDLNRFFDALIYSHESFVEKKAAHKKKKIGKLQRQKKRGRNVVIPSMDDQDSSDEEFDRDNIIYPPEIVEFMYSLKPVGPEVFDDCARMSGQAVKKYIEDFAITVGIDLYTF